MNVKPITINHGGPLRLFAVSIAISIASLSLVHGLNTLEANNVSTPTRIDTPATYAIQSLKITSPTSGTATITLDDFILNIGFDFETYEDSYGVPGSEFTNATITNLAVEKLVSISGTEFRDFTDHTDHYQINAMITGYILKHRLVEGV